MARGYAVVQRGDGAVVRDPEEVTAGERLLVRLAGGRLDVEALPPCPPGGGPEPAGT